MSQQSEETKSRSAETTKAKLLFVDVPKDATEVELIPAKPMGIGYMSKHMGHTYDLPPGDWQILSRLNDATEEQAASVVDEIIQIPLYSTYDLVIYADYTKPKYSVPFAIYSLKSLTRSLGFTDEQNPLVLVEFKK